MNLCDLELLPYPLPPTQQRMRRWVGGKNKGVLQAGYARLQNPIKKVPLPPAQRGEGDRGQKLILNLWQLSGNLLFF